MASRAETNGMKNQEKGFMSKNLIATLDTKRGKRRHQNVAHKRARYVVDSDEGAIKGYFYAIVSEGETPAQEIVLVVK